MTQQLVKIGDVAEEVGISEHLIRQWERRYGYPVATKTESGHRRYDYDEINRLKLVKLAVEEGYKPKDVVAKTANELNRMLCQAESHAVLESVNVKKFNNKMIGLGRLFAEEDIYELLEDEWQTLGWLGCVADRLAPLMIEIGRLWKMGKLTIAEEHYLTEAIQGFLSMKWRKVSAKEGAKTFVLTTLPGETHVLGLHFLATILAFHKQKVVFLGAETPYDSLRSTVKSIKNATICVSISAYAKAEITKQQLEFLDNLSSRRLIIGGKGARRFGEDYNAFQNLKSFHEWLKRKYTC